MNLLVVGATGTLGRQVARRALDEGHQVRCLVRNPRKASFLKEWGAELVGGNLCQPESLTPALEGIDAIIDAATARATDSVGVKEVDWEGQVNLIKAAKEAGVERFIFFSILNAEQHRDVPLMDAKYCVEEYLKEAGMNYTILRLGGFMQGLIAQYAIPILENQAVWITGESSPIAYMNTQDIAKFAVQALKVPATEKGTFPVVGTRAWKGEEIIAICERYSGQTASIARLSLGFLRLMRRVTRFFQWGQNASDRLAFAEVMATGKPLAAPMADVYETFELDPAETTTLESYLQEYFSRIMQKLKEIDYEKNKGKKNKNGKKKPNIRTPF
ncbi:MAG: SDR family oxidoreductase [Synechococcus sp.]|nr:SDR family oxidoreductase [Synechococcus sp.]